MLSRTPGGTRVLGICGPSGSGKTWLARQFQMHHPGRVAVFPLDGFYRELARVEELEFRHDNPNAIDFDQAGAALRNLKSGRPARVPVYDFHTHSAIRHDEIQPAEIMVVEGLFAFAHPEIRAVMDIRLWIEAPESLCLERRIGRDSRERGRSPEEILQRFHQDVQPAFRRFIHQSRACADVVVVNDGCDPQARPLIVDLVTCYLLNGGMTHELHSTAHSAGT